MEGPLRRPLSLADAVRIILNARSVAVWIGYLDMKKEVRTTMKRRLFQDRLKEDLKNPEFRQAFEAEDLPARLALRIAELRQKQGLSQAEQARRLGAKQQLIARIESLDHTNMTLSTLQKIAQALHKQLVVELR